MFSRRTPQSTKEAISMGEVHFKQINQVTGPEKDKYEFEDLSKKIIGAAIEVHSPQITQISQINAET